MSFPYKQILCPVDFDDNSIGALREAAALASHGGNGDVHVLHVVQINPLAAEGAMEGFTGGAMYEAGMVAARQQAERMAGDILAGVSYQVTIEFGAAADTILAAEEKLGADLVVMATHGRKGLKRLVLGSVTERVVRESRVPVLTIPPRQDGSGADGDR